jgi:hypothetical protein
MIGCCCRNDIEKPTNNPNVAHPEINPVRRFVVFLNPYCAPWAALSIFAGPGVKPTVNMNHVIARNVVLSTTSNLFDYVKVLHLLFFRISNFIDVDIEVDIINLIKNYSI